MLRMSDMIGSQIVIPQSPGLVSLYADRLSPEITVEEVIQDYLCSVVDEVSFFICEECDEQRTLMEAMKQHSKLKLVAEIIENRLDEVFN